MNAPPRISRAWVCVLAGTLLTASAQAQDDDAATAWSIETHYTSEVWRTASGHAHSAYLDDLDLLVDVDGGAVFGAEGLHVFAYGMYNNGHVFNDKAVGSLQGVTNIESVQAWRLFELWAEQQWTSGWNLRAGLYDINSEFDAIDSAGLFINPSHGIGPDYSQTGDNGPSIFPNAGMAARLAWQKGEWAVRAALLEAVPGDPEHPDNTTVRWDADEGFLYALEANRQFGGDARVGFGYWRYSEPVDTLESAALAKPHQEHNDGEYAFVEAPTIDTHGHWRAFMRIGHAAADANAIEQYVGAGVTWSGFVATRPDDQLGFAIAHARVGHAWGDTQGERTTSNETIYELTARFDVGKWLTLQPDVQYVAHPGALADARSTWVMGLRFESGFVFDR